VTSDANDVMKEPTRWALRAARVLLAMNGALWIVLGGATGWRRWGEGVTTGPHSVTDQLGVMDVATAILNAATLGMMMKLWLGSPS